jgi:excisionase family DNA binding protein
VPRLSLHRDDQAKPIPATEPLPGRVPQQTTDQEVLLLTPREAARALAISERSLWGLTQRGLLACVRLGRSVRYDLADLRAFITTQKCKGRK